MVRSLVSASTMKMTTIQNVAMSRGSRSVSDYGHAFNPSHSASLTFEFGYGMLHFTDGFPSNSVAVA
ncbi:hypothetical protein ACE6H2_022231 [Prunus campanulata]